MDPEYRADGWPLCPRCGEDELWSAAVPADAGGDLQCYECRWAGRVPVARWNNRVIVLGGTRWVHTTPIDDLIGHTFIGGTCECKPRVVVRSHGTTVVHNSADGRELVEEGGVN
jgi:hypothetical protein